MLSKTPCQLSWCKYGKHGRDQNYKIDGIRGRIMRKSFTFIFGLIALGFGIGVFLENAHAQDKDVVSGKQAKQFSKKGEARVLTIGEHGQFKGLDGFQMALNMVQDGNEIRIEKGVVEASGLSIPKNKRFKQGITISGGWNNTFNKRDNNPESTTIDGSKKDMRIFTIPNTIGKIFIQNLTFSNSGGGAVLGAGVFNGCVFKENLVKGGGGAINTGDDAKFRYDYESGKFTISRIGPIGTFTNCKFMGNTALSGPINKPSGGGAVYGEGIFTNCVFAYNRSENYGGAVTSARVFTEHPAPGGTFINCRFIKNLSEIKGGAASGVGTFINSTFYRNQASRDGGAIFGGGEVINSIFYKNGTPKNDNDIMVFKSDFKIDFSLFNYISGSADIGENNITGDPKFIDLDSEALHLRTDSPCINKGKLLSGYKNVKARMIGTKIPGKGVNIGAY